MNFYIIPTPIGNLNDLTERAKITIEKLDILIVESKQKSRILLEKINVKDKKILIYNDKSSGNNRKGILDILKAGKVCGLVSDAGTPLLSDPGFKLIRFLIDNHVNVVPLPGPTSITTGLIASGLPTDKFQFLGFFPKTAKDKVSFFRELNRKNITSIFFESSHRIRKTLEDVCLNYPNSELVVAKELTKIHEKFLRGKPEKILNKFKLDKNLSSGEFVILFYKDDAVEDFSKADLLFNLLKNKLPIKEIAKLSEKLFKNNKNKTYKRYLSFSKKS
ncbi:MAG: 16S rRNA (cytidine(1402)-2'-O)-methyltransferase [SAR86 cluster bacterium]|jgi:16S rRNA (cytidine1402-2'-O)-methyltransferase|nr:MAG: 16S rRNA (cytidine(1402)-2'-O)-methyltransferase [SAR86 cluster bacterium]|tara:strand:- start:5425 stop:6252 length:828 start_codon:yes stop_codon:yes gene_type:complete